MPRQLRIDYAGAIHHPPSLKLRRDRCDESRGDRREYIYQDDVDRQEFLKTLAEACQKADWQVHAYCLMDKKRCDAGRIGEFQECECQAAHLDASGRKTDRSRRENGKTKKIMPRKRTELRPDPFPRNRAEGERRESGNA